MGHLTAKSSYQRLQRKLDGLSVRVPDHIALRKILEELYTAEEAELLSGMPFGLATACRIARNTGGDRKAIEARLDALASRGLVMDLASADGTQRHFMISPLVIGIFEFTMMRTGTTEDAAHRARLFHEYLQSGLFYASNFGSGQLVSVLRTVAHEGTVDSSTEVLDHQRARAIVERHDTFAVGICSCRHEKEHTTGRPCKTPLSTCTAFGTSAEYLLRNGLARKSSREEMFDILERSRDQGLVLSADNVRNGSSFICHCCRCCCNMLAGVTRFGYSGTVITSGFELKIDESRCNGCNRCLAACPVNAIAGNAVGERNTGRSTPKVDTEACIGCGVCATQCSRGAAKLVRSQKRHILPENTFERVLLQCLERGTLQNLIFDNPQSNTQEKLRNLLGGFLRLPVVKRALISDALRSTFLSIMTFGAGSSAEVANSDALRR